MWRIESELDDAGAPYDRRAAVYDRLVRSRVYNRLAWSCAPREYEAFAARALGDGGGDGWVLEAAAGSAAATAALHRRSGRPTLLVDLSRAMLQRAGRRLGDEGASQIHLIQADVTRLPFTDRRFTTVLALGLLHLFDDLDAIVAPLRAQAAPDDGRVWVSSLVAETARGRRYMKALHHAGEIATPCTAAELHTALGTPRDFRVSGCMAYAVLDAAA